jgi:hypothetical protein
MRKSDPVVADRRVVLISTVFHSRTLRYDDIARCSQRRM